MLPLRVNTNIYQLKRSKKKQLKLKVMSIYLHLNGDSNEEIKSI